MAKDVYEDYKRHISDNEENDREVEILRNGVFVKGKSKELYVGQIVKIMENCYFPCDLLIIKTSTNKNNCFIETKNLDGGFNIFFYYYLL